MDENIDSYNWFTNCTDDKLLKWFRKLFRANGLIMERVMLLCTVFISFVIVVNFKAFILMIENGDYFNFLSK